MNLESSVFTESALGAFAVPKQQHNEPLGDCVRNALENYFAHLDGHGTQDLYRMVMEEVERPLFTCVMQHLGGNQTRAAELLGISRSTLRKKLALYGID
jgi:Fis family transcriptional regulator